MAARVDLDGWPGSMGVGNDEDAVDVVEDLMERVGDRLGVLEGGGMSVEAGHEVLAGEVPAPSTPQGAGDFVDVAWVVAQALGNGAGVRGLEVHRGEAGALYAYVRATDPAYVRGVAASFGWSLYEPDGHYANASGRLGELLVSVSFLPADVA